MNAIVLGILFIIPAAHSVVDCRTACRICHEGTELEQVLDIYCAMCTECKERRKDRLRLQMQRVTETTTSTTPDHVHEDNVYSEPNDGTDASIKHAEDNQLYDIPVGCPTSPPCSEEEEDQPTTAATTSRPCPPIKYCQKKSIVAPVWHPQSPPILPPPAPLSLPPILPQLPSLLPPPAGLLPPPLNPGSPPCGAWIPPPPVPPPLCPLHHNEPSTNSVATTLLTTLSPKTATTIITPIETTDPPPKPLPIPLPPPCPLPRPPYAVPFAPCPHAISMRPEPSLPPPEPINVPEASTSADFIYMYVGVPKHIMRS